MKEILFKIESGHLEDAVEKLLDFSYKITDFSSVLIMLKSNLTRIKHDYRMGVITIDQKALDEKKVGDKLFELTNSLKKLYVKQDYQEMITIPPNGNEINLKNKSAQSPFKIRKHLVTQYEWIEVMGLKNYKCGNRGNPNLPVENVSWDLVQVFIDVLNSQNNNFRLPTENEWEYACMADFDGDFGFEGGVNVLNNYAWNFMNSDFTTHPIGELEPNKWGLHDMHGNVCEWVNDKKEVPANLYHTGIECKIKGGSFDGNELHCYASHSNSYPSNFRYDNIGFRLVCEA